MMPDKAAYRWWIISCILMVPNTLVMAYFTALTYLLWNPHTPWLWWGLLAAVAVVFLTNLVLVLALWPRPALDLSRE